MAKIKLNGDTSGYIEISAPAVSGNNTLELGPGTKILTNLDNTFTGVSTFSNGIDVTGGNVDIGGATHSRNLTVHDATNGVILIEGASNGTSNLMFADENDEDVGMLGYNHASNYLAFTVNAAERLRINSAGTLQVKGGSLHLDSNPEFALFEDNTSGTYTNSAKIALDYSGNVARIRSSHNGSGTSRALAFYYQNTESLRIDTNGYVKTNTEFWVGGAAPVLRWRNSSNEYATARISSNDLYFEVANTERLRIKSDGNVLVGNTTGTSTASPVNLSLGGTFSNSGGQNPKLNVWDNGTNYMSLGVSSNQLDFMMSSDDYDFVWYGQNDSNNGPEERMRVDNGNKLLDFASTCKIRLKGSYATGQAHAHLNIGSDGAGSTDTRAIDIWGSWSDQESKSITWNHGTTTSQMVCQQRVRYNQSPSTTVYEIGRFYNGQDTTAFPFKLQSTSTTTADLTVEGNVLHKTAAFVARSTSSDNIQTTTGQKIDYTVDYSYDSVFNNTNDRFTCTKAGLYFFYARHWFNQNTTGTAYLDFMKNGSLVKEFRFTHPSASTEFETVQGSGMIYMAVNDYLEVNARSDGTAIFHESAGAVYSEFSGFYVSGG